MPVKGLPGYGLPLDARSDLKKKFPLAVLSERREYEDRTLTGDFHLHPLHCLITQ